MSKVFQDNYLAVIKNTEYREVYPVVGNLRLIAAI